jgi:heptosyltransferase-1
MKLTDGYFFRNKKLIRVFKFIDFLGKKTFKFNKKTEKNHHQYNNILISNIGHLGDILLSLKAIEVVREKNNNSKIYFISSSSSYPLIKDNPLIDDVIIYDDFFLLEKKNLFSLLKCFFNYLRIVFLLRNLNIDIAFDLRAYFPNTLHLLWLGGVKNIYGYPTVGFGFVLSKKTEWIEKHETEHMLDVLRSYYDDIPDYKSLLPINIKYLVKEVKNNLLFEKFNIKTYDYLVFHIVSRDKRKMINIKRWLDLYNYSSKKYNIVFTGNLNERKYISEYFYEDEKTKILAGELSIGELITLTENSKFIITIDSFIGQVVSLMNLPSIVIFSGGVNSKIFGPIGDKCIILRNEIECAPCNYYVRNNCRFECNDIDILKKFIEIEKEL